MSTSCIAVSTRFAAVKLKYKYVVTKTHSRGCVFCTAFARRVVQLSQPQNRLSRSRYYGCCAASNVAEVLHTAREQLYAETDHRRPDSNISLVKACLLIALEEEAAADQELRSINNSSTATWLETLIHEVQPASGAHRKPDTGTVPREVGSASSWSLARLISLADEVKACFVQQHAQQIQSLPTTMKPPPDNAATLPADHTSLSRMHHPQRTSDSKASDPQLHTYSLDPIATAMHQYPTQAIAALNTVLFERHGYHRMLLHGNPRDAQLNNVLDYGSGTPVALAILYMEVARRVGYPMVGCPLEGDKQCLVWPKAGGLKVNGADFVIDPYSQGALYSTAEVAEMFDLDIAQASGLRPASKRQIIAALLTSLRDAHWAQALGCFPEPGLMLSVSLAMAADGAVQPMHGYHITRALAAAERRFFLLPDSRHVQLEQALLLYFASQHEAAVQELQLYKDQLDTASVEQEQLGIVMTRLRFMQQSV